MKSVIPRYNFYKTKYGSELLIDVVDLKYTRKFLTKGSVHILTYYDRQTMTSPSLQKEKGTSPSATEHTKQLPVMYFSPSPVKYVAGIQTASAMVML